MIINRKLTELTKNHITDVYLEHYRIVTCILCVEIFSNLPATAYSSSHLALPRLVILYMEAIEHLLVNAHHMYATGLKLLFQNSPKIFLNTTRLPLYGMGVPLRPGLTLSRMSQNAGRTSFPHIQENVFTEVPEWSIGSDMENFFTTNRPSSATPNFHLNMRRCTLSEQQETVNIPSKLTAPVKLLPQTPTSTIFAIGKSAIQPITPLKAIKKKFGKLRPTITFPPVLQFLYEKQEEAWVHPTTIPLLTTPKTWRIGLYSLEHSLLARYGNDPKIMKPRSKSKFTTVQAWWDLKHSLSALASKNLLTPAVVSKSSLNTHGKLWQVEDSQAQPMIKAPVVAYQYQPITPLLRNQSKKNSSSSPALGCILDAASRTWIQTSQANPFGTLILLIFRWN